MALKMGNFCHFTSNRKFSDNFNLFTTSDSTLEQNFLDAALPSHAQMGIGLSAEPGGFRFVARLMDPRDVVAERSERLHALGRAKCVEWQSVGLDAEPIRASADVLRRHERARHFGLLLDDAQKVDVMGEHNDLAQLGFLDEPTCDMKAAAMVQRGNGVVEDDPAQALAELHLRQERRDGDGPLLALAQDGGRRVATWELQGQLELGSSAGRLGLHGDLKIMDVQRPQLGVQRVSDLLSGHVPRQVGGLSGYARRCRSV